MKNSLRLLAGALVFFAVSGAAVAAGFSDVPATSVHYGAIEYLQGKGVIGGYPDGTFQPDKSINRAEALKILLLATSTALDSTQTIAFPDVHSSDWFYPYVRKAFELKIIEGYSDGTFKPDNNINLAESLKTILLSFKAQLPQTISADPYADVAMTDWYAPYAQYSKDKNVVEPQDDGKLHAEAQMTRADFAEIVYRLMYINENSLTSFPLGTNWPEFDHPTDHYSLKYPFDWAKIVAGNHMIFWKQDVDNGQVSFARIFPNSSTVYTVVDPNQSKLSLDQYLAKLQYDSSAVVKKSTLNNFPFASVTISGNGLEDYYFQLPNGTILIAYTQVGSGPLASQLDDDIQYMINSITYNPNTLTVPTATTAAASAATTTTPAPTATTGAAQSQDFLSQLRQNLLVSGKGKTYLNQMPDAVVISTDTIGIGTGPVDYYYSPSYNVTIKYERTSDTLLAMKDGKTTAF